MKWLTGVMLGLEVANRIAGKSRTGIPPSLFSSVGSAPSDQQESAQPYRQDSSRLDGQKAMRWRIRKLRLTALIDQQRSDLREQLIKTLQDDALGLGTVTINVRSTGKHVVAMRDINKGLRILKRAKAAVDGRESTVAGYNRHHVMHFRPSAPLVDRILEQANVTYGAMAGMDADVLYHEAQDPFLRELRNNPELKRFMK